jgi:altronate dehydratase
MPYVIDVNCCETISGEQNLEETTEAIRELTLNIATGVKTKPSCCDEMIACLGSEEFLFDKIIPLFSSV